MRIIQYIYRYLCLNIVHSVCSIKCTMQCTVHMYTVRLLYTVDVDILNTLQLVAICILENVVLCTRELQVNYVCWRMLYSANVNCAPCVHCCCR